MLPSSLRFYLQVLVLFSHISTYIQTLYISSRAFCSCSLSTGPMTLWSILTTGARAQAPRQVLNLKVILPSGVSPSSLKPKVSSACFANRIPPRKWQEGPQQTSTVCSPGGVIHHIICSSRRLNNFNSHLQSKSNSSFSLPVKLNAKSFSFSAAEGAALSNVFFRPQAWS